MRVYGLTGGMASGKSEAAKRFRELGIPVLDADHIGHEVIAPGGAAEAEVTAAFGPGILTDGVIDRRKLGTRVFASERDRVRLNSIVHPAIRAETVRRCQALAAEGHEAVLYDAALLGEDGRLDPFFAGLILVLASRELRVQRVMKSRGLSRDEAERRIAAQTEPEKKLVISRWVIHNESGLDDLRRRVDEVARELRHDAGQSETVP